MGTSTNCTCSTNNRSETVNYFNFQETLNFPTHPSYDYMRPKWIKSRHSIEGGEDAIKAFEEDYLPKTYAMKQCSTNGRHAYEAYLTRARYYDYPKITTDNAHGLMIRKPPKYDRFPEGLEDFLSDCNSDGESFTNQIEAILQAQLAYGRYIVLVDVPSADAEYPKLQAFEELECINWTEETVDGENILTSVWFHMPEKEWNNEISQWEDVDKVLVCALATMGDKRVYYQVKISYDPDNHDFINSFNIKDPMSNKDLEVNFPTFREKRLDYIPVVFFNSSDLKPKPSISYVYDIVNLSIALYRQNADYSQALFMQGQATPVFTGFDEKAQENINILGATGSVMSSNDKAKAYFMEVEGEGLTEMRLAEENTKATILGRSVALVESSIAESGEALKTRIESKSAPLINIVATCQEGIAILLGYIADWMAIDKSEFNVVLNKDFTYEGDVVMQLVNMMAAYEAGAPFLLRDIHKWAEKNDLTTSDFNEILEDIRRRKELQIEQGGNRNPLDNQQDSVITDNVDDRTGAVVE